MTSDHMINHMLHKDEQPIRLVDLTFAIRGLRLFFLLFMLNFKHFLLTEVSKLKVNVSCQSSNPFHPIYSLPLYLGFPLSIHPSNLLPPLSIYLSTLYSSLPSSQPFYIPTCHPLSHPTYSLPSFFSLTTFILLSLPTYLSSLLPSKLPIYPFLSLPSFLPTRACGWCSVPCS